MGSNFERHLINQRMTTSLSMSPSYIASLICLLTRIIPDPLVANKRACNRLIQEDTKPSIRQAFGQTSRGHDCQQGDIRELPSPTLSDAVSWIQLPSEGTSETERAGIWIIVREISSLPVRSFTSPSSRILDGYSLELAGRRRCEVRRKWLNHAHQIQLPHHQVE